MRYLVFLVLMCKPSLVHGQDQKSFGFEQEASKHGGWRAGRMLTTTNYYSCKLPITQPLDQFALTLVVGEWFRSYKVWGLDHFHTLDLEDGSMVSTFVSKRTMYPPRIVMNFHLVFMRGGDQPNVTCFWSDTNQINKEPPKPEGTTAGPPFFENRLPNRNPRALPPRLPPGFIPPEARPSASECNILSMFLTPEGSTLTTTGSSTTATTGPPNFFFPGFFQPEVTSPYESAITLSMNFYTAQRSGILNTRFLGSPNSWSGSSGLNHIAPDGTNLVGGWHTGNDLVKTNLPMASSVTLLAWGLHVWKDSYRNIRYDIRDTLTWPLDYFRKCWKPEEEMLYVQVGDFYEDRSIWERADNKIFDNLVIDKKWPFFAATPDKPASDVAAEMASAMIVSFIALGDFEGPDLTGEYLSELFEIGLELYHFAVKYQGAYSDHIPETSSEFPNYKSSHYKDELCVAAMWIYIATYNETYLEAAKSFFEGASDQPFELSWDNKYPACAVLLAKETRGLTYIEYVNKFLEHWTANLDYTDGLLAYHSENGPLRYAANAAFVALLADEFELTYADATVPSQKFAIEQINYMLGKNPQKYSYQIGFGDNYPRNPFHKNSACPPLTERCGWSFFNFLTLQNSNELNGALVGGPDINDDFVDSRAERTKNSVAIDYNAGFQSALAGLMALETRLGDRCSAPPSTETTTSSWTPYTDWSTEDTTVTSGSPPPPTTTTSTTTRTTPTTKYTTTQTIVPPKQPTSFDFGKALGYSNLFYMAQKHGEIPENYPVTWRYSPEIYLSSINGGWFDDGSEVITSIAMASSATLLGWGGLQFKEGYQRAGELENLYEIMRVPLLYFHEMWEATNTVYVKSGNSEVRFRAFWSRPEDNLGDMKYGNFPISLMDGEGADIMADIVTALTLGSRLFEEKNSSFSELLLRSAESLYRNISQYPGVFEDPESWYYSGNKDEKDELCLSAAWLYKVTNKEKYKTDAIKYAQTNYKKELSWDNKHVLCEILMYEILGYNTYRRSVKAFVDHWVNGGVKTTPQGLAWNSDHGPLRYAANAAFVALLAGDMGIQTEKYQNWAKSQIEYMLGKNSQAYSYQIGYGSRFPRRPHHRGSSCPDYLEPCDWSIYNAPGPNPHVLIGALVGGPDSNDFFEDARTNYTMNRVAVDYNAGFQSTLAGLIKVHKATTTTSSPIVTGKPSPQTLPEKVKTTTTAKKTKPTESSTVKPDPTIPLGGKKTLSPNGVSPTVPTSPEDPGTSQGATIASSLFLVIVMLKMVCFVTQN